MGCCGITWPAMYLSWFADSLPIEDVCTTSLFTVGGSPSPFWQFTWCSSIIRAKRSLKENYSSTITWTHISNTILRYLRHTQRKMEFPLSRQLCLHTLPYHCTNQINQTASIIFCTIPLIFSLGKNCFICFYVTVTLISCSMISEFWELQWHKIFSVWWKYSIKQAPFLTSLPQNRNQNFFYKCVCVCVCNMSKLKTIDMKNAQPSGKRQIHTQTSAQIKKHINY